MNKFLKWLKGNEANIIFENDIIVVFTIKNIKYKFEPTHRKSKISFYNIYRLEPQLDESLPDIKTLVTSSYKQNDLINEFENYLNK